MTSKLSEYFTWAEVVRSKTAAHFKLDNSVPSELRHNVIFCANKMDSVRRALKNPVLVSSWYRSPKVNWNVGGSKTSQHLQGLAVDFTCPAFGTPYEVCQFLAAHMEEFGIDQLIYEVTWVHVSFSPTPRHQALTWCNGSYLKGIQQCGK